MATRGDFQGIAADAAAQYLDANSRNQPQRQKFPGGTPFALDGADFAAAAGGQFVKTDFSGQSNVVGGSNGLRV